MWDIWVLSGLLAVLLGIHLWSWRRQRAARRRLLQGREGQLALQLSRTLGCLLPVAWAYVVQELSTAPAEPDEELLRRAADRYRQTAPASPTYFDPGPCRT